MPFPPTRELILTSLGAFLSFLYCKHANAELHSPFQIMIDGGSTGSRLHIFEFTESECVRRGSARADVPLSSFAPSQVSTHSPGLNSTLVASHLLPVFEYAAERVPHEYHLTTPVKYQATAGMRLLTKDQQEAIYDALYKGLLESDRFVFRSMKRSDIGTLSGEEEGYYGAVAANYLHGTINVNLELIPQSERNESSHFGPIGALDMGGSSTQIVFLPGRSHAAEQERDSRSCCPGRARVEQLDSDSGPCSVSKDVSAPDEDTCHSATLDEIPSRLNGQDFFATSYLSYGADQFRERLWTTLVHEHRRLQAANSESKTCDAKIVHNPCAFRGYEVQWEGYTLLGTGDAHDCATKVRKLIPLCEPHAEYAEYSDKLGRQVGGVEHPPVHGKFIAMSLYFFTLDSLRELSHSNKEAHEALNTNWPTPSINELSNALDGLCSRSWKGDLEEIQHNAHAFTRPEVLPHRCLESVYMVTLLRDGFGFHPDSRDITFTFLVDGSEVEWSLGMALVWRAQLNEGKQGDDAASTDSSNNNATFEPPSSRQSLLEHASHQLFEPMS